MISSADLPSLSFASIALLKAASSYCVNEAAVYSNLPISAGLYVRLSFSHIAMRVSFEGFSMKRPKILVMVL